MDRSQDNLRESIKESITDMREENQNNLKRIEEMQACLIEECISIENQTSIDRLENNLMNLEERVERRFIDQSDQQSSELHEMENKIAQNAKDENGKLRDYVDLSLNCG